ncbi:MAG: class I SAM-dependent methyltransferase [Ignavibacteria bacterium]|nr:class I SAM-dependent methyltransferase [Ignavibacteria bacterium]
MKRKQPQNENPLSKIEDARKFLEESLKRERFYSLIVKHIISVKQNGKFLEIGSGPCVLTKMLANEMEEGRITALDISEVMNKIAGEYIKENSVGDKIEIITGDTQDEILLNKLGKYDLIYSTFAMHHWQDANKIICELYKSLNPGGYLIIYDFIRVWWLYYLPLKCAFFPCLRSSFKIKEIKNILNVLNINHYIIQRKYFFFQGIEIKKCTVHNTGYSKLPA